MISEDLDEVLRDDVLLARRAVHLEGKDDGVRRRLEAKSVNRAEDVDHQHGRDPRVLVGDLWLSDLARLHEGGHPRTCDEGEELGWQKGRKGQGRSGAGPSVRMCGARAHLGIGRPVEAIKLDASAAH